jgi:hypothetical protein
MGQTVEHLTVSVFRDLDTECSSEGHVEEDV